MIINKNIVYKFLLFLTLLIINILNIRKSINLYIKEYIIKIIHFKFD